MYNNFYCWNVWFNNYVHNEEQNLKTVQNMYMYLIITHARAILLNLKCKLKSR